MKPFLLFFSLLFPLLGQAAQLSPKEALERLKKGNDRYVHDELEHPNRTSMRREAIVSKQTPYAIVLGCLTLEYLLKFYLMKVLAIYLLFA